MRQVVPIRRDGNISHLFIALATQRSMGEQIMTNHSTGIVIVHFYFLFVIVIIYSMYLYIAYEIKDDDDIQTRTHE